MFGVGRCGGIDPGQAAARHPCGATTEFTSFANKLEDTMKLRDDAIDTAVIRIFRDCHVYENGRLAMASLETDWKKLHLRREDLYDALDRLERSGHVRTVPGDTGLFVVLLTKGWHRIADMPHTFEEMLRRGLETLQLAAVDRRHPAPLGADLERRRDDPHTRH
jgi:hypothetical protein